MLTQHELMAEINARVFKVMNAYEENEYSMDHVMWKIADKYNFRVVDSEGGFIGNVKEGEVYVPNAYGQEDDWEDANPSPPSGDWIYDDYSGDWHPPKDGKLWYGAVDYVMLFKNRVAVVELNLDTREVVNIINIHLHDIILNLEEFRGKRGYYYVRGEHVQFRTNENFYNTLPDKYKCPGTENWVSGPHFTINLKEK